MDINHKIRLVRQQLGLSQKEMAEKLQLDQSYISDIERGKASVSGNVMRLLHEVLGISADWLISGKGSPLIKSSGSRNVDVFVEPNVEPTQKLRYEISDSAEMVVMEPEAGVRGGIPLLEGSRAQAGYLASAGSVPAEEAARLPQLLLPGLPTQRGRWVALYTQGDSMQPTLQPGDLLVCQLAEEYLDMRENSLYVVVTDDDVAVKRISLRPDGLQLLPDNPAFEAYYLPYAAIKQLWEVRRRITAHLGPPSYSAMQQQLQQLQQQLARLESQQHTPKKP